MKKIFTLLWVMILAVLAINAQDDKDLQVKGGKGMQVMIRESMQLMADDSRNSLTMAIPNADEKKVTSVWQDFSKDFEAKARRDRKTKLYFSDDASLPELSENDVDVYAKFEEGGTGTVITLWFDLGGAYLASETHENAYQAAEELMKDFANAVGQSMAEDNVDDQEDILNDLEKDLKGLEKDNQKYQDKIEEAKKLIAEMESNIKQNLKDQEAKQKEITAQKETLDKAKDKVKEFK